MRIPKIILLICLLFSVFKAFPQNNISVHHAYGKAEVVIPIFNLEVDGLKLPIYLEYDATGVRTDKIPSGVGLNWTLFTGGSIEREIVKFPDESTGGILKGGANDDEDKFFYHSLFGLGKFEFRNQNLRAEISNNLLFKYDTIFNGGAIRYFEVIDELGNNYYFGDETFLQYNYRNKTNVITKRNGVTDNALSANGVSSWLVKEIETRNHHKIYFSYEPYTPEQYSITNYDLVDEASNEYDELVTTHNSDVNLIKSISSGKYYVEFNYETDANLNIWKKRLASVIIKPSQSSSAILKKVEFTYGTFEDNRLKLLSVATIDENQEESGKYDFQYYNKAGSNGLMAVGTQSRDYFGYYNDIDNSNLQAPEISRVTIGDVIANWSLEKITAPNGSVTTLLYEPNKGLSEFTTVYYCYYITNNPIGSGPLQRDYIIEGGGGSITDTMIVTSEEATMETINYPGLRIKEIITGGLNKRQYVYSDTVEYENGKFTYRTVEESLHAVTGSDYSTKTRYNYETNMGYPYVQNVYVYEKGGRLLKEVNHSYQKKACCGFQFVSIYDPYLLTETRTKEYFSDRFADPNMIQLDSDGTITTITEYSYNDNWLISGLKNRIMADSYSESEKRIKYTIDYSPSTGNFGILQNKNIIAVPVDQRNIKNGNTISGTIGKLDGNGNILELYQLKDATLEQCNWSSSFLIPGSYFELARSISYDSDYLVKDVYTPLGDKKAYKRDARGNVIAEISNALSGNVYYNSFETPSGIEGEAKTGERHATHDAIRFYWADGEYSLSDFIVSYWYYDTGEWKYDEIPLPGNEFTLSRGNKIDEVRIFPKNASMFTYNYDEKDRVISQTDVNNITAYYEYDARGNMSIVRDHKRNIRESYEYTSKDEVAEISTSASTLSFERTGGSNSFQATSDKDYTIEPNDSWINVNKGYMFGTQTIDVSCEPNEGLTARSGALTITSHNTTETVYISQDGPELSLSYPDDYIGNFPAMGGTTTVNVDANFDDWTVLCNDNLVTVSKINNALFIECPENHGKFGWVSLITINGRGSAGASFEISQEGAKIESVSPSSMNFDVNGGTNSATVSANFNDWSVSSDSWISTSESGNTVHVSVNSTNPGNTARTGTVTISGRGNTKAITVLQGPSIISSVSASSLSFGVDGGTKSSTVTANFSTWEVTPDQDWITTTKSGNTVHVLVNSSNPGNTVRTGTVTISGNGNTKTITVSQDASVISSVSPTSLTYGLTGGTKTSTVTANFNDWAVSDNSSWITTSKSGNVVNIHVTSGNLNSTNRTGAVTISGRENTKTVSVTQTGVSLSLNKSSLGYDYNPTSSQTVSITSNYNWAISENSHWIATSKTSGSGNSTFTISCLTNSGSSSRTGTVTVTSGNVTKTITITQECPELDYKVSGITNPSSVSVDAASSAKRVYIYSNAGSWAVTDNVPWITVSNAAGNGDGNATLNISSNPGSSSRTATITISSTHITKTFTVTQTAESLTVSPTDIMVDSSPGSTSFTITSNTSWAISENHDWISLSRTSGSGNATIYVNYGRNTNIFYRLGIITVSGNLSSRNIRIGQDKGSGGGLPEL